MARLAEYLSQFAALLGCKPNVHFDRVKRGSAALQAYVDPDVRERVFQRIAVAPTADAPEDVRKAYRDIDEMLRQDNATGQLKRPKGGVVLRFPGRKRPVQETFTLWQASELQGVLVRVGGRGDTIPIWLEDVGGKQYTGCYTKSRAVAREIAVHLYSAPIRLTGNGKWKRTSDGMWELEEFNVQSFVRLDEASLEDSVAAVKAVEGNEWHGINDADAELKKIKDGKQ